MRIAEINMTHNGSTGKIMLGIAEVARQRGHDVWTFSPRYYQKGDNQIWPEIKGHTYFGTVKENKIHHHLSKITGYHGCFSKQGTKELINYLEKVKPDIIHLHNLHNWTINIPMLFSYVKKKNVQVVWTLHDCWAITGQCPYFTMEKCDKWKRGCGKCSQINVYPDALVDRTRFMWKKKKQWFNGIKNITLVTPSEWLANLVKQSYLGKYPIKVINNGIDLFVFRKCEEIFKEKYHLQDKKIVLGVAFDWGIRKGLDVFQKLAKTLDNSYQIVLVGTNENIDKVLPTNIISIHRTVNQQQLAEIYTAADVFVNPTREDNFPTVNIESLACETPVITFQTGGSSEMLDDTCGSVIECNDVDSLQKEIKKVCTQNLYSGPACRKRAKKFDMNKKFEEYVELYEEREWNWKEIIE